jgi:hypothetical protein
MATAVGLSHDVFDAAICLGTCDKIVPGLLIGALQFPALPVAFSPAGPMPTGASNAQKAKTRQLHAEGKVGREALLDDLPIPRLVTVDLDPKAPATAIALDRALKAAGVDASKISWITVTPQLRETMLAQGQADAIRPIHNTAVANAKRLKK